MSTGRNKDTDEATGLSRREMQVATYISLGKTNHEIAEYLTISVKTVDTHRMHVMKKLGTRNNVELTHHALKRGWVQIDGLVRIDPTAAAAVAPTRADIEAACADVGQ